MPDFTQQQRPGLRLEALKTKLKAVSDGSLVHLLKQERTSVGARVLAFLSKAQQARTLSQLSPESGAELLQTLAVLKNQTLEEDIFFLQTILNTLESVSSPQKKKTAHWRKNQEKAAEMLKTIPEDSKKNPGG